MKALIILSLVFLAGVVSAQGSKDTRYLELRIYYAAPGKLDALIKRFNDHTIKIFEKHGMQNIGYWVPVDNDKNALYYVLAYKDKDTRKKAWEAFGADPEWKTAKEASEQKGKLVDSVKSVFMYDANVMPGINGGSQVHGRAFELRTYYCYPNRLPNLLTRFKDHTMKLFEKHGMTNIAYWLSEEPEGKQSNLVYMLSYPTVEGGKKSWDAFRADPDWIKVRENSEKDGKIVERVESVFLKPLPFSQIN